MAFIAFLIALYSYLIFGLGLIGLLYKKIIVFVSASFLIAIILLIKYKKIAFCINFSYKKLKDNFIAISIIVFQTLLTLIIAFTPELSFDALWYHLTLPKLYLERHSIIVFKNGLLYYSAMPQMGEMLYVAALSLIGEVGPKLIHWIFSILCLIVLYKFMLFFVSEKYAFIGIASFATFPVVGWLSTTAYIDLMRVFFEICALFYLYLWKKDINDNRALFFTFLIIGFALCVKHISITLWFFVFFVVLFINIQKKRLQKQAISLLSFIVASPWYMRAFVATGNPVYPFSFSWFSGVYGIKNFMEYFIEKVFFSVKGLWFMTYNIDNLISPIFIISFPLILFFFLKKSNSKGIFLGSFVFFSYFVWILFPNPTARFFLPGASVWIALILFSLLSYSKKIQNFTIFVLIFFCIINSFIKTATLYKYIPYLTGAQTKSQFLSQNLNFDFGDFYDTDNYLEKTIRKGQKVLFIGGHNLFYANFSFDHESWAEKGTFYDYILVQKGQLPKKFGKLKLLYVNAKTKVKLYEFGKKYF